MVPTHSFGVVLELPNSLICRSGRTAVKVLRTTGYFSKNTNLMVQVMCRWLNFLCQQLKL